MLKLFDSIYCVFVRYLIPCASVLISFLLFHVLEWVFVVALGGGSGHRPRDYGSLNRSEGNLREPARDGTGQRGVGGKEGTDGRKRD